VKLRCDQTITTGILRADWMLSPDGAISPLVGTSSVSRKPRHSEPRGSSGVKMHTIGPIAMAQGTAYAEAIQATNELWASWLSVADYLARRWLDSGNPDVREAYILWVSGRPQVR